MISIGALLWSAAAANAAMETSSGALVADPIVKQMLLPDRQPGRCDNSATMLDKSGVQCSAHCVHDEGVQETRATVIAALGAMPVQLSLAYARSSSAVGCCVSWAPIKRICARATSPGCAMTLAKRSTESMTAKCPGSPAGARDDTSTFAVICIWSTVAALA